MPKSLSEALASFLESPLIHRVRQNHGLEHATLHMLSQRHPRTSLAGHSGANGFWIVGDVSQEEVQLAGQEALRRLQSGEHNLAIHPYCGTNLATAGVLAGMAAGLTMLGGGRRLRDKLDRLPLAVTLATLALMIAQPLGAVIQERVTTSGSPESLQILQVIPKKGGRIKVHRVVTGKSE